MIYELHHDLRTMMADLKFPVSWSYGPTPAKIESYHSGLIVVERDRSASDQVLQPRGAKPNPRMVRVRGLVAEIRVYARSSVESAHIGNHETECEKIVDALLVSLYQWGAAARVGDLPITEAKYLSAEERDDVETWPGVVYRIRFVVPRGVYRRDYTGVDRPLAPALLAPTRTTQVYRTPRNSDPPATGCDSSD